MSIVTGTLTVNAAFLREIKDDNRQLQELLATLRDLMSNPVAPRNHSQQVVELLESLTDQLAFHFALEEAYGYFEEAIDVAPRITERADDLRAEHAILFEFVRKIAETAEQWHSQHVCHRNTTGDSTGEGTARSLSFHDIAIQFQQFSNELLQHEQNESALILEAYDTDIGGQG